MKHGPLKITTGNFPAQPPIQWVPGALPLGVERPGREADHSPPPVGLHGVVLS